MQIRCTLTEKEKQYLIDNWQLMSDAEIAKELKTTKNRIYQNRNVLGLYKDRRGMVRDMPNSFKTNVVNGYFNEKQYLKSMLYY
jgi:hypothetical protein